MRKFLMAVAIGGFVLLMAAPAMALDFKFGAEYRVRFYDGVNIGFDHTVVPTGSGSQFINTQAGPNARGAQIRIRPRFDVSDDNGNMTATLRLEIGDVEFGGGGGAFNNTNVTSTKYGSNRTGNGAGGGGGADGINVETKWAFVDFAMPWGVPLRVRAGIQPAYLPKGIVIDDDVSGVRAYGTYNIFSYDAWWWRISSGIDTNPSALVSSGGGVLCKNNTTAAVTVASGTTAQAAAAACTAAGGTSFFVQGPNQVANITTTDNNYDVYGFKLDAALHKMFNPGAYFLYVDNRINCAGTDLAIAGTANQCTTNGAGRTREGEYFGLTFTGDLGWGKYDLDWIYGSQKGGVNGSYGSTSTVGPITVAGWALDGHVGIPIGPVVLNLAGSYATGDKRDGGNSEAFPGGLAPSWNGPGGGFELLGSGGPFDAVEFTQDSMTNLWTLGLWLEYRPIKALWLKAAYAYAGFSNKNGNCAGAVSGTCYGPSYGSTTSTQNSGLVGSSSLGQEFSLRADYDLWTNFKVQGQVGWFFPSKGDVAGEYVLQLYYNF